MNPKVILFADLDGTLLDDKYDHAKAQPIIKQLISLGVSIVVNSSKTKLEVELYRKKLGIKDPYIIENGSAIIIPKSYFANDYNFTKENQHNRVIELGTKYSVIRSKLELIAKKTNAKIIGFGDMTISEIADDAGLPLDLAEFSKKREYDEPFKIVKGNEADVLHAIEEEGLYYTKGGNYYHVLGNTNKGKATAIIKQLYIAKFQKTITIGVGDGQNDLSMLKLVDKPFMIQEKSDVQIVWREIIEIAKTVANKNK